MVPAVSIIATHKVALTISNSAELVRRVVMFSSTILGRLLPALSLSCFHSLPTLCLCLAMELWLENLLVSTIMEQILIDKLPPMIRFFRCIRTKLQQQPRKWFKVATSSRQLMFSLLFKKQRSRWKSRSWSWWWRRRKKCEDKVSNLPKNGSKSENSSKSKNSRNRERRIRRDRKRARASTMSRIGT